MSRFLEYGCLPTDHQYYYQIQTQMMACETYFADFAVYSFPDEIPKIVIQRIEYDIAGFCLYL